MFCSAGLFSKMKCARSPAAAPLGGLGLLLALVLTLAPPSDSARILFTSVFETKSMMIFREPLILELANRGHQVTIVSMIPWTKKHPNVKSYLTPDMFASVAQYKNFSEDMFSTLRQGSAPPMYKFVDDRTLVLNTFCKLYYESDPVKLVMKGQFDLVVSVYTFNECGIGLIHHFGVPFILQHTNEPQPHNNPTGLPYPLSHLPVPLSGFSDNMTFWQRTVNFLLGQLMMAMDDFKYEEMYTKTIKQFFPSFPGVDQVARDTSLVMANSDPILNFPRPTMPDVIEVGAMHCRPAQKLPADLKKFAQESGDAGFIVFSLGSVLTGCKLPDEVRKAFLGAFAKLKQRVIWKWETETMPDLPPNVKLVKWLPQQDLLGHPKCKAFISHGGLHSLEEAIYHGVPLVGIPLFYDQDANMKLAEHHKIAVTLRFSELDEKGILDAVNTVIDDQRIQDKADKLSQLMRDKQHTPLETAVFYVEYILRHQGAKHLRSPARKLNFFQYHSYDVIGFLTFVVVVMALGLYFGIRALWLLLCCESQSQGNMKSKTQ